MADAGISKLQSLKPSDKVAKVNAESTNGRLPAGLRPASFKWVPEWRPAKRASGHGTASVATPSNLNSPQQQQRVRGLEPRSTGAIAGGMQSTQLLS